MTAHGTSVSLTEAKNKLSEYVDRAARGEVIVITKYGRPAAQIVPLQKSAYLNPSEAVRRLKALRATNPRMTVEEIIGLKNTGR